MPKHLLWWGGVFLSLGGVIFCMGTTARLAGQFNNVHYTGVQSVSTKEARCIFSRKLRRSCKGTRSLLQHS